MALDRRVVQEVEYPFTMSWELAERKEINPHDGQKRLVINTGKGR